MRRGRRLYLNQYVGLVNRLESLILAFAIRRAHGHEIFLDWKELDALVIDGCGQGSIGPLRRIGALRWRSCTSEEVFAQLGRHRTIILRTYIGPPEILRSLRLPTVARIRVRAWVAAAIRDVFGPRADRPMVGVHIRRGDYTLTSPDVYDASAARHPAVPIWWYERAMAALLRRSPDAVFYLSHSGPGEAFDELRRNFDVVQGAVRNPNRRQVSGHESEVHPVVDLFSLACCPVILGTPMSSFTHWAANLLGPRSTCVLPRLRVSRSDWGACEIRLPDAGLEEWSEACKSQGSLRPLSPELSEIAPRPVSVDWLPVED